MKIIREWLFRIWYWYVNSVDKHAEILFMNYGFSGNGENLALDPADEINRYSLQLYHLLAGGVDCRNRDVVEIGCGRGGGLAYVAAKFSPASARGIDLDKNAVAFSQGHYHLANLSFQQGDAQHLNLKNESCDIVINVESSHRYPAMHLFLSEVRRILRPKGFFLFTDFRYGHETASLQEQLDRSGLHQISREDITAGVVAALEKDDARRRMLVKKLVPKILHGLAYDFAGTIESETYNNFLHRKYVYFMYVFQKRSG